MPTDDSSRFEVLEEETHYPKRENDIITNDTITKEEDDLQSLDAQFKQLVVECSAESSECPPDAESTEPESQPPLIDCTKDAEKASKAKNLGNK